MNRFWLVLWASGLLWMGRVSAQFDPVVYWNFEGASGGAYTSNVPNGLTCAHAGTYQMQQRMDGVNGKIFGADCNARQGTAANTGRSPLVGNFLNVDRFAISGNAFHQFGYNSGGSNNLNAPFAGTDDFTLAFWYRSAGNTNEMNMLNWNGPDFNFELRPTSLNITFEVDDGGPATFSAVIPLDQMDRRSHGYYVDGEWHQIVVRYERLPLSGLPNRLTVFVDGYSDANFVRHYTATGMSQDVPPAHPAAGTTANFLFSPAANQVERTDGDFDEIALWNQALPDNLIQQHYLEFRCVESNGGGLCYYECTPSLVGSNLFCPTLACGTGMGWTGNQMLDNPSFTVGINL
ncbi:MAG: LamG-like jellyroll fold domain-containing protein, partial [Bacteroidota bacterium]